jgi:stage V sporulation protein G
VQITEVRIKLMEEDSGERLRAFCSITFDDAFVVRDLKIIEGTNGPFVAMPSRKLTSHCPNCGSKNHLRALHCNQCGRRLPENRVVKDDDGRARLYADIAHPINSECREMIQQRVVREFREELIRAKQVGYVSRYEEFDFDAGDYDDASPREPRTTRSGERIHVHEGPQRAPSGPHHAPPAAHESPPPTQIGQRENGGEANSSGFGQGIFD